MPITQEDEADKELTADNNHIRNSAIEELKSKLESKDIDLPSGENMIPEAQKNASQASSLSEEGLIVPRKPPNPMLENVERQNLHRELLFNKRMGKNVLNQKSELQKALERHKDNAAKKEQEHHVSSCTPELEKVIADRAKRLGNVPENGEDKGLSQQFLEARAKLRTRTESK